jgi:hypothetical protein
MVFGRDAAATDGNFESFAESFVVAESPQMAAEMIAEGAVVLCGGVFEFGDG